MEPTTSQRDRAAGVLLGQAIGDALGVPYEFGSAPLDGQARMLGGGLGNYRPGEWSDDTQMAICIARVTATGVDPLGEEALNAVAHGFLGWYSSGPADIGNQTRAVLSYAAEQRGPIGRIMTQISQQEARAGRAGNGALMRTGVVGLVALADPVTTARAAERFAALTHADPRCVDSCIIWSEAVRLAVVEGRLDVRAGLPLLAEDRRAEWEHYLVEAETQGPVAFTANGYTVTALQAAWAAIHSTRHLTGTEHVLAALQAAIEIGHDTDTVAAIAGALLGARYGVSGLPADLAAQVQGWPYWMNGKDLVRLALDTATGGPARGACAVGSDDRTVSRIAGEFARAMLRLRGTLDSATMDLDADVYVQFASYDTSAVMCEVSSNGFLPEARHLTTQGQQALRDLGFTAPDDGFPNWWIGVDDGSDDGIRAAASALARALCEVYGYAPADVWRVARRLVPPKDNYDDDWS
ncbi:hypothetical protein GCM10028820_03560 [Tessaracoccus terricola]